MSWTRRSSIEIIGEILDLKRSNKTEIMYRVNMSSEQMATYLDLLENNGLIEKYKNNGRFTYETTERGVNLLERIQGVLKELGLNERREET
jgi:predicted transcriptional regulator